MMIKVEIYSEGLDKFHVTTFVEAFPVSDDSKHVYFFENGWPCHYDEFLNPEDIIPSGFSTLNESKKNKERVLKQLKIEHAGTEMVELPKEGLNEFFQSAIDEKAMEQKIKTNKVQVPIDSMKMLEWAIYGCNQHVFKLLGSIPIMFTKELKRTDGKVVERYNHKLKVWEVIPGTPRFSDISIVRVVRKVKNTVRNIYGAFIG